MGSEDAPRSTLSENDRSPEIVCKTHASFLANERRDWLPQLTWMLLIAGFLWRIIRLALHFPLRGDEAMLALNLLDHHFAALAGPLELHQVAPPLFLIISQILRLGISSNEWVLRLVPLLAALAALWIFFTFTRKWLDPLACAIAVALMAVSDEPNLHATEFKPYALDLFFGVMYLQLGWRLLRDPARSSDYFWLAILAPLSIALSFPAVFLFAGVSAVLLPRVVRNASRQSRTFYVVANILAGMALFFVLKDTRSPAAQQTAQYMHAFWSNGFPSFRPEAFARWLYTSNIRVVFGYPYKNRDFFGIIICLLSVAGIADLVMRRQRQWVLLLLAPFAVSILAAVFGRYPYGGDTRLQQHLAPAVFVLTGVGFSSVMRRFPRHWPSRLAASLQSLPLVALLAIVPVGIVSDFRAPFVRPNDRLARAVAASVPGRIPPGTTIYSPGPVQGMPPVFLWYLNQNCKVEQGMPPVMGTHDLKRAGDAITDFGIIECASNPHQEELPQAWEPREILNQSFLLPVEGGRSEERRCSIYLYRLRAAEP